MEKREWKVCVTGGGSYIHYIVHATIRSLKDKKTDILRGFLEAKEKLVLFEADLYRPRDEFEPAISRLSFCLSPITLYQHQSHSKYKDVAGAATQGIKIKPLLSSV